ncbi:MAG: phage holin [Candidatus Paceibacterota bacterium]
MKNINWKIRLQSYPFWVAFFALVGLIIADLGFMSAGSYQEYVDAILLILIAGGVVSDPTTNGYKDSDQALAYDKPRKEIEK